MESSSTRRLSAISRHFCSRSQAHPSAMPVVIGAMVTDIHSFPSTQLKPGTTIVGQVSYTFGGVARNVAECMMKLGVASFLISVIGDDMAGMALISHWESLGLPVDGIRRCSDSSTPVISIVFDTTGEIAAGVADTAAVETHLTTDWIHQFSSKIQAAPIILLDANLMPATLEAVCKLAKEASVPVWYEPVSVPKSVRATNLYKYMTYVSPNEEELVAMGKALCPSATDHNACIVQLLQAGVQTVVLTLGSHGLIACSRNTSRNEPLICLHLPALAAEVVSLSGAGDCLVAGSLVALSSGRDLPNSLAFGVAIAKQAVQSQRNVPLNVSASEITDDADVVRNLSTKLDSVLNFLKVLPR